MGEFLIIGKSDLTDTRIRAFWHDVMDSGRDGVLFCDNPLDEAGFVHFVRRADVQLWLMSYCGVDFAAFWLTDIKGRKADIHFCILPVGGVRRMPDGTPIQYAAGMDALEFLFSLKGQSGMPRLEWLIGQTPLGNRAAQKFADRLGGQICGMIPGGVWYKNEGRNADTVLRCFTKDNIKKRYNGVNHG